jgi:hypothetical protein
MTIGIITHHIALNAGAVLQSYALQTVLKRLGHHAEFIDYCPYPKYVQFSKQFVGGSKLSFFDI